MARKKAGKKTAEQIAQERVRRAKIVVERAALSGALMEEPGADVRLKVEVYDPLMQGWHRLPGWEIGMKAGGWMEIEELRAVVSGAIEAWARGRWDAGVGRLRCGCGRAV